MKLKVKFLCSDSKQLSLQFNQDNMPVGFDAKAAVFVSFTDKDNIYVGILYIGYLNGMPYVSIRRNFGNLIESEHQCSPMILKVQRMVLEMVG